MSPRTRRHRRRRSSFPRVSGDEPETTEAVAEIVTFSPRERG